MDDCNAKGKIVLTPIPPLKVFNPNKCCSDDSFMEFEDEAIEIIWPDVKMCSHCGWEPATVMFTTGNNPIKIPRNCERCWEMLVRQSYLEDLRKIPKSVGEY